MIERKPREGLPGLGSTQDGSNLVGREYCGNEFGQKIRRSRRELGRFEHHTVAGRQRRNERRDGELKRVIPRADDADNADRLIEDARAAGQEFEGHGDAPRQHPAAKVLAGVTDRRQHGKEFADFGFVARTIAEIGGNRRRQPAGILFDRVSELCQVAEPLLQRRRAFARERRPLRVKRCAHCRACPSRFGQNVVHSTGLFG